ncbi:unnamed protein product [Blepharisma stoltei]|uniref:COX assembly mitochondrial protein n=1 Tax=Blepharisma stoltei TaxID=1481888 RepID=A0AAU9IHK5_9CILI|nr:unnamed protein product [Blepharisma stoltei]
MFTGDKRQVEPYDFLYYYSPSIPYDFPKERIPKNLCEKQLLLVFKCFLDYPKKSEDVRRARHCQKFSIEFNECKKRRDMDLYKEIRAWEEERVKNLKPELRAVYVNALKEEVSDLRSNFEQIPATDQNANKRWRINADILQTQWRIRYTEELLSKLVEQ